MSEIRILLQSPIALRITLAYPSCQQPNGCTQETKPKKAESNKVHFTMNVTLIITSMSASQARQSFSQLGGESGEPVHTHTHTKKTLKSMLQSNGYRMLQPFQHKKMISQG